MFFYGGSYFQQSKLNCLKVMIIIWHMCSSNVRRAQAGTRPSLWRPSQLTRLPISFVTTWCVIPFQQSLAFGLDIYNQKTISISTVLELSDYLSIVWHQPWLASRGCQTFCGSQIFEIGQDQITCSVSASVDILKPSASVCSDATQRFARAFPRCS